MVATAPDRADRVNDVFRRQGVAARDLGRSGRAAAQAAAFGAPAARWMAPSTPPPPASDALAALTMASTASVVISATRISSRAVPISALSMGTGTGGTMRSV
jgi:hypothetical protein